MEVINDLDWLCSPRTVGYDYRKQMGVTLCNIGGVTFFFVRRTTGLADDPRLHCQAITEL